MSSKDKKWHILTIDSLHHWNQQDKINDFFCTSIISYYPIRNEMPKCGNICILEGKRDQIGKCLFTYRIACMTWTSLFLPNLESIDRKSSNGSAQSALSLSRLTTRGESRRTHLFRFRFRSNLTNQNARDWEKMRKTNIPLHFESINDNCIPTIGWVEFNFNQPTTPIRTQLGQPWLAFTF